MCGSGGGPSPGSRGAASSRIAALTDAPYAPPGTIAGCQQNGSGPTKAVQAASLSRAALIRSKRCNSTPASRKARRSRPSPVRASVWLRSMAAA